MLPPVTATTSRWRCEHRFRSVFVTGVMPYLAPAEAAVGRRVCMAWCHWIDAARADAAPAPRVPPDAAQIDTVIDRLRALHLLWSPATDAYVRRSLSAVPCIAADGSDLGGLTEYLSRLYHRAVVAPKTNISTLDTAPAPADHPRPARLPTRVIERFTQARLSRFHTTGAASIANSLSCSAVMDARRPSSLPRARA